MNMSPPAAGLPFQVLAAGRFEPAQVRVGFDAAPRRSTPALDGLIELAWRERLALASRSGQQLFNGNLLRYVAHDAAPGRLGLTVGPTCYRDFVGTNLFNHHRLAEFGWDAFANPIGATATLLTSDGMIVYGRRSARVAYHAGYVHTFGGALEAVDRGADGGVDVFAAVRRELTEEVGLADDDIAELVCVGLVRDTEIVQPELLFEARLRLSLGDLVTRYFPAEAADEHCGLAALLDCPEIIIPFLEAVTPTAPVAVAGLFLHGWQHFGPEWWMRSAARYASIGA